MFIIALALLASSPWATPPAKTTNPDPYSPDRKEVSMDDDKARRFMDDFARCVASRQSRKAAAILAMQYGSKEQSDAARDIATSEGDCLGHFSGDLQLGLNAPSLAGGMAEYFIAHPGKIDDVRRRDPQSFVYVEPAGLEGFGECVVAQNPAAVESLVKSEVGSDAEIAAGDALGPELGQCVSEGQTISVDRGTLRQLLAVALYKHVAIPRPAPPAAEPAAAQH
jgi:hypothetical protein